MVMEMRPPGEPLVLLSVASGERQFHPTKAALAASLSIPAANLNCRSVGKVRSSIDQITLPAPWFGSYRVVRPTDAEYAAYYKQWCVL